MATNRRRVPQREATVSRGPKAVTVFLFFLLLAALCLGAGYTIGNYILTTLGDKVAGNGGQTPGDTSGGGGIQPGDTGAGGTGGSGGGAVPAGGGAGTVTCGTNPLAVYALQVGAFGSRSNADKVVADLAAKGYPGYVIEPPAGEKLYKVRTVTLTRKDVAETVQARLKTQGFPDCFVATENLDATALKLSGSSLDYLNKVKAGIENLASCLRIEGDIWDKYRSGNLDRTAAGKDVDALVTSLGAAKDGLAGLAAPQDLAALGQAVDEQLAAAKTNLASLKAFLTGQTDADRLKAESSYIALVDAYARLGASLRAAP